MMRQRVTAAVFAASMLLMTGCQGEFADTPVARVNGQAIRAGDLAAVLPPSVDSGPDAAATKRQMLDQIIDKQVFVQEAERRGLEDSISYQLELEQKHLVTQELYRDVVAPAAKVSELELENARKLLLNEARIRLIETETDEEARKVLAELEQGVPFETLAVRLSKHQTARTGGDFGFLPELWLDFPMRDEVLSLSPGEVAGPIEVYGRYRVVRLEERRAADPPPPPLGEIRQELEFRLKKAMQYDLAERYLASLRERLEYRDEGLDVLCKPVDSITPEEQETWVAVRDGEKYVKVGNLLRVARRFPPSLDTAMRRYAVRREIEEDLIYEDGLKQGFDRLPAVREGLERRREDLLYQVLYRLEVSDRVEVGDEEIRRFYDDKREMFGDTGFEEAADGIRQRLLPEKRRERLKEYTAELREGAEIEIYEEVLDRVSRQGGDRPPRTPQT